MSKWEYLRSNLDVLDGGSILDIEKYLNAQGLKGWELVSYHYRRGRHISVFKRPLHDIVFKTKDPKQYEERAKKILNE